MRNMISSAGRQVGPFEPTIASFNPATRWLIQAIAEAGLVPKVENLGAGVKRISVKGLCCPICGKEVS